MNKHVQGPINRHNPLGTRVKTVSPFTAPTQLSQLVASIFNAKRWMSRAIVIGLGTDSVPTPMQHNDICPIRSKPRHPVARANKVTRPRVAPRRPKYRTSHGRPRPECQIRPTSLPIPRTHPASTHECGRRNAHKLEKTPTTWKGRQQIQPKKAQNGGTRVDKSRSQRQRNRKYLAELR